MEIKDYTKLLVTLSMFNNFSCENISKYINHSSCRLLNYNREDIIFIEDEHCKNLSIILKGAVEIQKIDASGKILTVAKLSAGDAFGENLIFGDKNFYPMTVVSKDNTVILHISKNAVIELCQADKIFLNEFLRLLSNKAFSLSTKIKEVTLKNIRQKICEFLLWKSETQNTMKVNLGMSKKDWAEKIGVQRPSLSRELIKLKEDGIIEYDKNFIFIKDMNALKNSI